MKIHFIIGLLIFSTATFGLMADAGEIIQTSASIVADNSVFSK